MDSRLSERLSEIERQIETLQKAEHEFLSLEAHSKSLCAHLFLTVEGKTVAEKEAQVYSSKSWAEFSFGHVEAEAKFNYERRKYELALKSYDAEHLTLKQEYPAIKRQL